jgi:transposase
VTLHVLVRRFRCLDPACPRRTFAERLTDVAAAAARRTDRLGTVQRHLALAMGGEAAARLTRRLAMIASPDTLLRMIGAAAPDIPARPTPRVLGVDDWAWRRGHRYGTMLVDLERDAVVDLLPDRQAGTLAAWLRRHPGVQIVARDRAGAYADGVRQGAPEAIQVADRWHLLCNLSAAVQGITDRHASAARAAARHIAETLATRAAALAPTPLCKSNATVRAGEAAFARRQGRYEEIARLRAEGVSLRRIAAGLGIERKTVRRWLRLGHAPWWQKPPRGSILAPYAAFLDRRWAEGCHNAAQLWRELAARGFSGRPSIVRAWAGHRRKGEPGESLRVMPAKPAWHPPVGRRLGRMLMADAEVLSETDRLFVARLFSEAPKLAEAITIAKRLHQVLRCESDEALQDVLDAARDTLLAGFAAGLRQDIEAVQAALDLPWTTSPVEGHINRLKMLKRTMYGRAGFALLRQRVLYAA